MLRTAPQDEGRRSTGFVFDREPFAAYSRHDITDADNL
jgi:hypothetical protein